jgi:hypothetical protein
MMLRDQRLQDVLAPFLEHSKRSRFILFKKAAVAHHISG